MLGKGLADNDRDLRLGGALIVFQFLQPALAPALGALALPENRATGLSQRTADPLQGVAPKFPPGTDHCVHRKLRGKPGLQLQFQHFALQLLGTLLRPALQFLDLLFIPSMVRACFPPASD